MTNRSGSLAILVAASLAWCAPAHALIVNGGFEAGFAGWVRADQPGSDGTFWIQSGTSSPVNASPVAPPPEGVQAAMSDAQGPGSHVLYQDFLVPAAVQTASLSFQIYVRSEADFVNPNHLDFGGTDLNQHVRVDLLDASSDAFTTSVLMNLFQTQPGDPMESGYSLFEFDVSGLLQAHAGDTLRLRFAEVDNVFFQNLGVDAVNMSVNAVPVPEPSTLLLMIAGVAALTCTRARRRRAA